eukprot:TRINITY_DN7059_c0_g3_i1.p1 TRINITY_DN7059_c0_g3~~TRINITY_DN7059_c0_g3_i1.p1  ORF type:complete len:185 (-),score=28.42 TRINITY_DN7059_c0_g3_i1:452-1006(-)
MVFKDNTFSSTSANTPTYISIPTPTPTPVQSLLPSSSPPLPQSTVPTPLTPTPIPTLTLMGRTTPAGIMMSPTHTHPHYQAASSPSSSAYVTSFPYLISTTTTTTAPMAAASSPHVTMVPSTSSVFFIFPLLLYMREWSSLRPQLLLSCIEWPYMGMLNTSNQLKPLPSTSMVCVVCAGDRWDR